MSAATRRWSEGPRDGGLKGFLFLYLPLASVILLVTALAGMTLTRADMARIKLIEGDQIKLGSQIIGEFLSAHVEELAGMLREPKVLRAFRLPIDEARPAVEAELTTLLYRNEDYDQARWLNTQGDELVRVLQGEEIPVALAGDKLANNSHKDWFKGTVAQPAGGIYVSALDLSVGGGEEGAPAQPVVRFGVRLPAGQGQDFGFLVVNASVQTLFRHLVDITSGLDEQLMLLNRRGYWLLAPDPNDALGFASGEPGRSFAQRQPDEWVRISTATSGQILTASGLWSWTTIDPAAVSGAGIAAAETWKLVTHVPAAAIAGMTWNRWWPLLLLAATTLGILFFGALEYRKLWLKREASASEAALAAGKTAVERRLRLATEGADVGVWYWDLATGKLEWSAECKKHLALPAGQEPGFDHFYSRVHPEDRERVRRKIEAAVARRQDFRTEYRVVQPDGSLRWVSAPGRVYLDPDGKPEAMSGLTIDITELKNSEASLRDLAASLEAKVAERTSEATKARELAESQRVRLSGFLDSLLDPHVLLRPARDANGKIAGFIHLEANSAACRYNQRERTQLIGKNLDEFLPWASAAGLFDLLCRAMESGRPLVLEDFRGGHGGTDNDRWFDIRAVKVEDMLSLTVRDVTAQHEAARHLAESQKQFRRLAENATDVVLETDLTGHVTYASPSSASSLGRTPEQLTGMPFRNLVHPEEWDAVESLEAQIKRGTPAVMEMRLRFGDDGYQWFSLSMKPLVEAGGDVLGCVVGLRDIRLEVQGREVVNAERARLKLTLDTLFDPFVLMQPVRDKNGKVTDFLYAEANSAACEWLQLRHDQLLGQSMLELFPVVESSGLMDFYRKTAETSAPSVLDEFPFPRSGATRWLDIRGVRVDERVSFVWRDMTERHRAAEQLAAAEERYRLLATNSADVVMRLDEKDHIAWISPALETALGWRPEEVIGRSVFEFLGNGGGKAQLEHDKEVLKKGGTAASRIKMRAKDGTSHWVGLHAGPYRDREGKVAGMVASFRVVDAEVRAEEEKLHQQEVIANERKHLADVIEGSDTGTWEWHVQTGAMVLNEIWAKLIGYRLEELQPVSVATWEKFTHPEDMARARSLLAQCFRRELETYETETRMRHRNGEWVWILTRGRVVEWTADGKPLRMLGTHRDITATVRLREELESQATTDPLTGLCNRRQFEKLAHRELSRARREQEVPCLLTMDIDKFKSINDAHGHDAGDEVLKSLARNCAPHLREMDVFARLGGEEFGLFLPETGLGGARHVAERIREALAASPVLVDGGKPVHFTVSIGVAEWSGQGEELPALMKRSDEALYRAKREGRNRVCTA